MKKGIVYKSMAALLSISMGLGGFLSYQPVHIEATEMNEQTTGNVLLKKDGTRYVFGNEFITRTFNTQDDILKTEKITNYRTDEQETVFVPQTGSEEFVINTLPNGTEENGFTAPEEKIDTSGWQAESDSIDTDESPKGAVSMFDGDDTTYYHSNYKAEGDVLSYPHNIYVDMKETKTINALRYQQRLYNGEPTVGGRVKEFKLYAADSMEALKTADTPVFSGVFDNARETYVNVDQEIKTRFIRIEFVSGYTPSDSSNPNVAACSEFDFFSDQAVFPETGKTMIKSSELTLDGEPILKDVDDGKTLTFQFMPIKVRNVDYTVKEIITMKNGDPFMRKHLEISVPQGQEQLAKIDYIDLENLNISQNDLTEGNYWTISELDNNGAIDMGNKAVMHELGQPFYLDAMYWGSEFPETENKIRQENGFIRYHYGKTLDPDEDQFAHYQDRAGTGKVEKGKMTTWPAVVGAASSADYQVVQTDFYEYIETIATKTDLRQQFNSWYDYQKNITSTNILDSFYAIEKGFTQNGVAPLDSYVVDDGWTNYSSFWEFNDKFPHQLYDSSAQVHQFGSNFGLWLGPRGGYGTEGQIASWIENNNLGSRNWNSGGDINVSDARYLNKLVTDVFLNYQEKFDINYWKLDGMLLNPSTTPSQYHVTGKDEYVFTETFERWTDMVEMMRDQRGGKDLWINMTSYTNPSPWLLQWVNSIFMQDTGDMGALKVNEDDTMEQQYLNYRDSDYYEFFNEIGWQLPAKHFYSHDPIYAKDAWYGGSNFTDDEFREYLYFLGTRGTAFWEYYFSDSIIDEDKWDINAEAAIWIEENFDILQKSKMFGGKASRGEVYGYSCWNGDEGIVSLRNPSDQEQTYTITYDRLIGMEEGTKDLYGKVILGDLNYQTNDTLSYGDSITYTLKPKEVLIMQYGEKDDEKPEISSIHTDGNTIEVTFDETIRDVQSENFAVADNEVMNAELKEDRRTAKLTLKHEEEDTSDVTVTVDGVMDTAGNRAKTQKTDDYYKDDVVNSIVNRTLDGQAVEKGNKYSIDGKEGFSITGKLKTEAKNAEIVRQEGSYVVAIDEEGYLTFTLNGVSVHSKYVEKRIDQNDKETVIETTKGMIADGKEHQFTAVKEVNGLLKLYIDGTVVASAYDEEKINPEIEKGNLVFADGLTGSVSYITVMDRALAYDEISQLANTEKNIVAARENQNISITAWDNTANKEADLNKDKPVENINNGVNDNSNDYFELGDTSDGKKHSRYIQIDLGDSYALNRLKMTRYFSDGRTYGPTVIALSETDDFVSPTIVYNSDADNVHGLGKGDDALYTETAQGKEIILQEEVSARYIRIYVYGNTNSSTSDHIVEFEAYTQSAGKGFYRIDYSELEALVNEDLTKGYTTSSVAAYSKAAAESIEEARSLLEDKDAVSDLQVETLVKQLKEHRNLLVKRADTEEAEQLLESLDHQDLDSALYKEDTWSAYASAKEELEKAVLDNSDINDVQMNDMIAAVKQAYENLSYKDADYSKVDQAIRMAEQLNSNEYKDFSAVEKAVNAVVRGKNITEQDEVDAMAEAILNAISALEKIEQETVNKDVLWELLETYDGYHSQDYTKESWQRFYAAYKKASSVVLDEHATQSEVDQAAEDLMQAGKALVRVSDTENDKTDGDEETKKPVDTASSLPILPLAAVSLLMAGGALVAAQRRRVQEED